MNDPQKCFTEKFNVTVNAPLGTLESRQIPFDELKIYNTSGQLVWRQRFGNFNGSDLFIIPSSNLAPGNYWLRINKDEDPEIIRRIIK